MRIENGKKCFCIDADNTWDKSIYIVQRIYAFFVYSKGEPLSNKSVEYFVRRKIEELGGSLLKPARIVLEIMIIPWDAIGMDIFANKYGVRMVIIPGFGQEAFIITSDNPKEKAGVPF